MLQQEYPGGLTDFLIKHSVKEDKAKVIESERMPPQTQSRPRDPGRS